MKVNVQGQGVGRGTVEGGLPNDAVAQGKKNVQGLEDTTNTGEKAERAAGGGD